MLRPNRNGVAKSTGIDTAIKSVCICAKVALIAILLAVPKNMAEAAPAQVGQAMNNPVRAPAAPILRIFLDAE